MQVRVRVTWEAEGFGAPMGSGPFFLTTYTTLEQGPTPKATREAAYQAMRERWEGKFNLLRVKKVKILPLEPLAVE